MADLLKERTISTNEATFLKNCLQLDMRTDGRDLLTFRHCSLKFGDSFGDVEVKLGKTHVIAGVSAEITDAAPDKPNEGLLNISIDFSPTASPHFEGSLSMRNVEISRIIDRYIRETGAIDTETLCLIQGFRVWTIKVDIKAINYEGNLVDACAFAAIAALRYFRRPDATVTGSHITIHSPETRHPIELRFHHTPIATSFAYIKSINKVIIDPLLSEELISDASLTISTNSLKEVCFTHKGGGASISTNQFLQCINLAHDRTIILSQLLKETLDAKIAELFPDLDNRSKIMEKYKETNLASNSNEEMINVTQTQ